MKKTGRIMHPQNTVSKYQLHTSKRLSSSAADTHPDRHIQSDSLKTEEVFSFMNFFFHEIKIAVSNNNNNNLKIYLWGQIPILFESLDRFGRTGDQMTPISESGHSHQAPACTQVPQFVRNLHSSSLGHHCLPRF